MPRQRLKGRVFTEDAHNRCHEAQCKAVQLKLSTCIDEIEAVKETVFTDIIEI